MSATPLGGLGGGSPPNVSTPFTTLLNWSEVKWSEAKWSEVKWSEAIQKVASILLKIAELVAYG